MSLSLRRKHRSNGLGFFSYQPAPRVNRTAIQQAWIASLNGVSRTAGRCEGLYCESYRTRGVGDYIAVGDDAPTTDDYSSTGMRVINGLFAAFSLMKAKEVQGASRYIWALGGVWSGYNAISGKRVL